MTFFRFSKILTQLAYPLGIAIVLLVVTLVLLRRERVRAARRLLVVAILVLWIPSTPALSHHMNTWLESLYPPVHVEDSPNAGAIVLMGGMIAPPYPPLYWMDLNESVDRILHAGRLWRAGKAPILIASGGGGPYTGPVKPADSMADLLVEWGVSRDAIVLERRSRTTYENALYSKELLDERGIHDILVVTSAAHMLRTLSVFRSLGLNAIPAATDYSSGVAVDYANPLLWMPDAGSLRASASDLKEFMGIAVYWMRGWIHLDALRSALEG